MITMATGGVLFNYRTGHSYYSNMEYEITMVTDLAFLFYKHSNSTVSIYPVSLVLPQWLHY